MSPVVAVVIIAAMPYADRLADKVIADRRDKRRAKGGQG